MMIDDTEYIFSDAARGDIIRIDEVRKALVLLLDESNYRAFRLGRSYTGLGGWYRRSPVYFEIPSAGSWHVVIDAGGVLSETPSASISRAGAAAWNGI